MPKQKLRQTSLRGWMAAALLDMQSPAVNSLLEVISYDYILTRVILDLKQMREAFHTGQAPDGGKVIRVIRLLLIACVLYCGDPKQVTIKPIS